MRRSELEIYVDVLRVLALNGPSKITHVMHDSNLCYDNLKACLRYLMQNNLVEMQTLGGKVTYTLTQRGVTVLRHFRELRKVVPLDEEDRKIPPMLR